LHERGHELGLEIALRAELLDEKPAAFVVDLRLVEYPPPILLALNTTVSLYGG
jgi:hypothetical protein